MIIIIDGPDGAGKDLLCGLISKKTGYKIEHLSHDNYERPFNLDLYKNLLKEDNVIYNRFYFSEVIYAHAKNRNCDLAITDCDILDKIMVDKNVVVIHVTNSTKELQRRIQRRGDTFINMHELSVVKDLYNQFMANRKSVNITISMNLKEKQINALLNI